MSHRFLVTALLLSGIALSLFGCSILPSKKGVQQNQAKVVQPTASPSAGTVEWKDRTWENQFEDRGVVYYVEKQSVSNPKPNTVQVWRKRTFPNANMSSHKEIVSLDEIDCRKEKFRTLQLQALGWDDVATPIYKRPTPWATIYGGTAEDSLILDYCIRSGTAGKSSAK
jgi:hypothetical protein